MDIALSQQLVKTFPRLYGSAFYFECNDGWYNLLYELSEKISEVLERKYPVKQSESDFAVTVTQVKEKYGSLRYYVSFACDEIWDLIEEYENRSKCICELCGQSGTLDSNKYWLMTLCDNHKRIRSSEAAGRQEMAS